MTLNLRMAPRFPLGQIAATPAALDLMGKDVGTVWVVTKANRSVTTLLVPGVY